MIRREEVFPIGKITKQRGIHGEVEMHFDDDAFDRGDAEYLVLQCDGLLVPFFWEEYRFKNDSTLLVTFEGVSTTQDAERIVGSQVFYPHACMHETPEDQLPTLGRLCGYSVEDTEGHLIGSITDVDDSSLNLLLTIRTPHGTEVLMPLHEDLIHTFDNKLRRLVMEIPDGILDL